MHYRRNIQVELENQINSKEIIVLTGMRRTGKTTLLKMIFDIIPSNNKVFLDLENILEQNVFNEIDYNNIWHNLAVYNINSKNKAFIFIDEIQLFPEIVKSIKYLYDHYDIKFFVTGSSSFYLKNLFPESLAGRKIIFNLFPLTFQEFLRFKNNDVHYVQKFEEKDKNKNKIKHEKLTGFVDEYLLYGGFPQVVLEHNIEQKKRILNDIFNSYFQYEVMNLGDFRKIDIFKKLIFLLVKRVGSKIDISKIASEISVSRETVYSYITFLEGTFFIRLLAPYSTNIDREVSGTKKVYLCDTGLINLIDRIPAGNVFENAVLNNIAENKISYYQKRSGFEIDFLLKNSNTAIEVKLNGNVIDYKKLIRTALKLKYNNSYLITKEFNEADNIIPFEEI